MHLETGLCLAAPFGLEGNSESGKYCHLQHRVENSSVSSVTLLNLILICTKALTSLELILMVQYVKGFEFGNFSAEVCVLLFASPTLAMFVVSKTPTQLCNTRVLRDHLCLFSQIYLLE